MSAYDAVLEECLEAVRAGEPVEACLRRYPAHAEALRPQLLAAAAVTRAFAAPPRDAFAAAARERFLVASGQRLAEAFDREPEPSFFAAARVRFLMAAHRMRQAQAQPSPRRTGFMERHFRSVAAAAAVLVLLLSFSTYTVASASNAIPGDWQYPVKLQTERLRLALTFSADGRLSARMDFAEERAREIEAMAKDRRTIGASVLARLVDQTRPLVDQASAGWNTRDLARLQGVAALEQAALQQARPQVAPSAQQQLNEAVRVTMQGVSVTNQILTARPDRPPAVVTPYVPLAALDITPTGTPTPPSTATATATAPAAGQTPGGQTPQAGTPRPSGTQAPTPPPAPGQVLVNPTPEKVRGAVNWIRIAAGRMSTLVPSPADGWYILGITGDAGVATVSPALVKLSNTDGTSLITLNAQTGDMYWFIAHGAKFDEVQMRIRQPDGQVLVADAGYLRAVYGGDAEIPLFVLANIEVTPPATATPSAAPSGTPSATPARTP